MHRKNKFFKILRKLPLTMIEVLIALSLSSLIMTAMFYFYQKAMRLDAEIQKIESQVFSLRLLESQLMRILPRSISPKYINRDFFFFTGMSDQITKNGSPYLFFSYDRGIDIDPLFSNIVLGRLYVDKKSRLVLAIWPAYTRWGEGTPPMKREILMENVESIAFSFYLPPDKESSKPISPTSKNRSVLRGVITEKPEFGFMREWKNEYGELPALMKLEIETNIRGKIEKTVLPFTLPYSDKPIIYSKG